MEHNKNINRTVDETLESVSAIEKVGTPPFFKEKVLNRMAQKSIEPEEDLRFLDWFTPKYQAAALIAFVVLNSIALLSTTTATADNDNDDVEKFAELYGLSEFDTDSYFYQN